ncbi:MAG TPA: arginase [Chitinophagaceae bacterium]|nr:arginase [Chitinophagaceae bacterium]
MLDLQDFLMPVALPEMDEESGYTDGQFAKHIAIHVQEIPDLSEADIVLLGVREMRGAGIPQVAKDGPAEVRKEFYRLHYWHSDVRIADLGDIRTGASLADTHAALKTVLQELIRMGKTVLIIGGSHDLTLAQYEAYKSLNQVIEATGIDARINLRGESPLRSENFLLDMLTTEPNMVRHYNHIAFQSYFVHPRMLETMDKLRFDCFRVGVVRERIEEMEPIIRSTNLLSFDISAIRHSDAPANLESPNGLTGEEACMLSRYAGMSTHLGSFGIYGFHPDQDQHNLTARQLAQMIWYFIDGKSRSKQEASLDDRSAFYEYHTAFTEVDTIFLQSKKTNRWWMQMPDRRFVSCSYQDYMKASLNEIPERWLRIQERN